MSKIKVRNPFTDEIVGSVTAMNEGNVLCAVDACKAYSKNLSASQRYGILFKTAQELAGRRREFAELITKESGISLNDSLCEVERAYNAILLSAEEAKRIEGEALGVEASGNNKDCMAIIIREPVGIICCITPFNHPLNQVVHKVCPAIAANNSVILKPSEKCPLTAIKFAELLAANGLPSEMLQVLTGEIEVIGQMLIENKDINMISFTGSTEVGEYITRHAGVKKLSLELGGNDVFIVAPDADIERAGEIAVAGAFGNSGQRCSSIKRIITFPENGAAFAQIMAEKARKLVVGDPMDPATDIGTVINEEAASEVEKRINEAIKNGAKPLTEVKRDKALLWPVVLDCVDPSCELVTKETFGPVGPIIRAKDFNDAISISNSTVYGLNAGIMTNSLEYAFDFARRLNVGGIRINQAPSFRNEAVPFGGNKMSGFGRSGIKSSIMEMTNVKTIIVQKGS